MELTWKDYGLTVLFWVGAIVITFFGGDVEKEHEKRGIDVVATITRIEEMPRKGAIYTCTYYNEAGELVEARLTLNQFEATIGQQVKGKYLPETPNHVYCNADGWMMVFVIAIFYIGAIAGSIKIYFCKKCEQLLNSNSSN